MHRHSLTWERQETDKARQRDYLTFALVRSGVCVTLQDANFDYHYIANLPTDWMSPGSDDPPTDLSIFGQELGKKLTEVKKAIFETGQKREFEWVDERGRTYHFLVELVFDRENGRQIFTTVNDLTDERRREKTLRTLLKEVSHRSKNLMAIIQSVASQTARYAPNLERFVESFHGRLQSLALAQDSIMETDWQGASLKDLLERQLNYFPLQVKKLVQFEGEDVLISPNATVHIGLALHELLSNAVNYGDFVRQNAKIKVCAKLQQVQSTTPTLTLTWVEPQTRTEKPSEQHKRFGSTILERVVPNAVSGKADYAFSEDCIRYSISFPSNA
ncbi:sensor histidine kinase [Maritalea myrionectae]|uniref:histidine kinase n=1 Tax=Maritalea myrionectae TaxID=454601 RepID=A0A2R4MCP0_9HYPH|nr:sensor histidine kinase [Maritalea myrionectae]AVX03649.1 protein-glutamate O-methyltransferase [Maritalea myrionectae]